MTGNPPNLPLLARICREHGALLYIDDAHGFGVLGERDLAETSPYGRRGNAIVRYFDESYDDVVLVGGFSKAYSSLLAFVACPTQVIVGCVPLARSSPPSLTRTAGGVPRSG